MRTKLFMALVLASIIMLFVSPPSVCAQMVQIPTLQVCNKTAVLGDAIVEIKGRGDTPTVPGSFKIKIEVVCSPAGPGYPEGELIISIAQLSDSEIHTGKAESTTFYQLTSMGKHSRTAFLNGPCVVDGFKDCRFWLMIVDNRADDKDIISFLIIDGTGKRLAHGTGTVVKGDVKVN